MTLYDIFYQHTKWWNNPSLGEDTQGKYGEVIKEMELCASDYAKDIKDVGDKWKWVIENETRELCRPNHFSFFLTGQKKEWHDTVVDDFLLKVRKAMQHYGFDFKELPRNIQALYGIEYYVKPKALKPQQKPSESAGGQLTGNGNETRPEPTAKPVVKEQLPTIYDDKVGKAKEQHVFYNAIQKGWMEIKGSTYKWKRNKGYLALLCGLLYWGDKVTTNYGANTDCLGEYPKKLSKTKHHFIYESGEVTKTSKDIKELFGGVDVSNLRSQLNELPDEYDSIVNLFPTD